MNETKQYSRDERIAYCRNELREVGPGKALSYLLQTNEDEKREVLESGDDTLWGCGISLNPALYEAACDDAQELLAMGGWSAFEDAIFRCHTITLAAAIGEPVLRSYLRNLLVELFYTCEELDDMIDTLIEMYKRRNELPWEWTQEYLDSWWDLC
jgi:hypothetical protein